MLYCGKCGLPPEYCEWAPKAFDHDECKKWLKANNADMFEKLYPEVEDGAEETKEEAPKKKKKKV